MNISGLLIVSGLALAGCGGANTTNAPSNTGANTGTSSLTSAPSSLEGKSFDVMLNIQGDQPTKDTLIFSGGKFESTACTSHGFPKGTEYTSTLAGTNTEFRVLTKSQDGTATVEWKGTINGDNVEGTAIRTLNGKPANGTFKGTLHK